VSESTLRALDDAIQAHLSDEEPGQILTGWIAQIVGSSIEDNRSFYAQFAADNQAFHVTAGLATVSKLAVTDEWHGDEDDDD
jgi:hypothetical protein